VVAVVAVAADAAATKATWQFHHYLSSPCDFLSCRGEAKRQRQHLDLVLGNVELRAKLPPNASQMRTRLTTNGTTHSASRISA